MGVRDEASLELKVLQVFYFTLHCTAATVFNKLTYSAFSRFDTIPECNGQTDGRTDLPCSIYRENSIKYGEIFSIMDHLHRNLNFSAHSGCQI